MPLWSCLANSGKCFWLALPATLLLPFSSFAEVTLVEEPKFVLDRYGRTPLAGEIEVSTGAPTYATLHIQGGGVHRAIQSPNAENNHHMPVLGLYPETDYSIFIELDPAGSGGGLTTEPITFRTPELPSDFPEIELLVAKPHLMEPGYLVLGRFGRAPGESVGYSIILDQAGRVVWFSPEGSNTPNMKPNRNLVFMNGFGVFEMSLTGEKKRLAVLEDPGFQPHHEFSESTRGTYLTLTRERLPVAGYPTSVIDPAAPRVTAEIEDNPVVEYDLDGRILHRWRLSDILDPTRVGYMSLGVTDRYTGGLDWAHANSVFHDPSDDTFIVSVRHQDAVIKIRRTTGELVWILGTHDNWRAPWSDYLLAPVGDDFEWQYHQHAAYLTDRGTIMLFDNGNFRATPFDGTTPVPPHKSYSRAVEYEVDESTMTVRQVWEYGANTAERLYSTMVSEAEPLPVTDNVLVTFGAVGAVDGVNSSTLGYGKRHARIIEVARGPGGNEKVFDVRVYDPGAIRLTVYRSGHTPSLYPEGWVEASSTRNVEVPTLGRRLLLLGTAFLLAAIAVSRLRRTR